MFFRWGGSVEITEDAFDAAENFDILDDDRTHGIVFWLEPNMTVLAIEGLDRASLSNPSIMATTISPLWAVFCC